MSQSSLIYLCIGTAFTAVSFLLLAGSKHTKRLSSPVVHWRKRGFKLGPSASLILLMTSLPLLSLIYFNDTKSLVLALPVLTLCLCRLVEIVKKN